MRKQWTRFGLAALAAGVVAAGLGSAWQAPPRQPNGRVLTLMLAGSSEAEKGDDASHAFGIDANAVTAGLYPGAVKNLTMVVTNPYNFDLKVTDLSASVESTSDRRCSASAANLVLRRYQGPPELPLVVRARQQRTAGVISLSMPNTVADGCQQATFTIRLQGTATKVNQ
jgi:hypothetical protein